MPGWFVGIEHQCCWLSIRERLLGCSPPWSHLSHLLACLGEHVAHSSICLLIITALSTLQTLPWFTGCFFVPPPHWQNSLARPRESILSYSFLFCQDPLLLSPEGGPHWVHLISACWATLYTNCLYLFRKPKWYNQSNSPNNREIRVSAHVWSGPVYILS